MDEPHKKPFRVTETKYVGELKVWPRGSHGDVGIWNTWWMMGCPRCGQVMRLGDHEVTVDDAGLVTISPSVGHTCCGAHFFVKDGKIRQVSDIRG